MYYHLNNQSENLSLNGFTIEFAIWLVEAHKRLDHKICFKYPKIADRHRLTRQVAIQYRYLPGHRIEWLPSIKFFNRPAVRHLPK